MPTVPGNIQPISMDVPGYDIKAANNTNNALAGLGKTIYEGTVAIAQDLQHSEAVDSSTKQALTDSNDRQDYIEKLKADYPTGVVTQFDPETGKTVNVRHPDGDRDLTITDQYKQWSEARYKEGQDSMPSSAAQDMYRQKTAPIFFDGLNRTHNDELKLKTQTFSAEQSFSLKNLMNRQITSPSPSEAYSNQMLLLQQLESKRNALRMDPAEYDANHEAILKSTANSVMMGYDSFARAHPKKGDGSDSRLSNINNALSVLDGKDDASILQPDKSKIFAATMVPEDRAKWIKHFEDMKLTSGKMDTSDWEHRVDMASRQALSREGMSPAQASQLLSEGESLHNSGHLSDYKYFEKTSEIYTKQVGGKLLSSEAFYWGDASTKAKLGLQAEQDSFNQMMSRIPPDKRVAMNSAGFPAREIIRDMVAKETNRIEKLWNDDPVDYAQRDVSVKTATAALNGFEHPESLENPQIAEQLRKRNLQMDNISIARTGEPSRVYLSNEEVTNWATMLKEPVSGGVGTSPQMIQRRLKALQAGDPTKYTQAIEQIVTQGKADPAWYMALMYDGRKEQQLTDEVIRAIRSKGKYPNAAETLDAMQTSEKAVKGQIEFQGHPFFSNLIKKSGSELTNLEHQAVVDTMFTMVMDKATTDGKFDSSTVPTVLKQFLGNKYNMEFEVGSTFNKQKVLGPVYYNGVELQKNETENMATNLTYVKENLASFNIAPPVGISKELESKWGDFLSNQSNTKFVYDDRRNAFNIKWYDSRTGQWNFMLQNGSPIKLPVEETIKYSEDHQGAATRMMHKIQSGTESVIKKVKGLF